MTDTKLFWPEEIPEDYLAELRRDINTDAWRKMYLCNPWEEETTMGIPQFYKGNFNITFAGPKGSGKTVAMEKVKAALEAEGYDVISHHGSKDAVQDHTLSVRWSK
jgi:Cdc6-like AAA superfamily ATPase